MTSVTIGKSVKSIASRAFKGTNLADVTINSDAILDRTYTSSRNLSSIFGDKVTKYTIGDDVKSIGDYAFYGCSSLSSITIPNSVTSIGDDAFSGCEGLKDIYALRTDPAAYNCVTDAFSDYSATLHVPAGSKEAYAGTKPWSKFANIVEDIDNSSDDAVVLTADGEGVWTDGVLRFSVLSEENGEAAVSGVKDKDNLGAVTIPEKVKIGDKVYSVTGIDWFAFQSCTGLTSVNIGNSVTSIGQYAFDGCTGLTSIKVEAGNATFDSRENCNAIIETASNTLVVGCKTTIIPSSVTSIGSGAFIGSTGLTSINIPNSVTTLRNGAFSGTGLTSITIPETVTRIDSYAFTFCTDLTSIEVEAGNSVYDSRDNCNAIIETESNTLIAGCMNTIIPESVTSIGDGAFDGCEGLTSVTIPSSVTKIGVFAFYKCI